MSMASLATVHTEHARAELIVSNSSSPAQGGSADVSCLSLLQSDSLVGGLSGGVVAIWAADL